MNSSSFVFASLVASFTRRLHFACSLQARDQHPQNPDRKMKDEKKGKKKKIKKEL